jgi:tetrahydromethanopterin S-methyltransferase subunit B
MLGNDIPGLKNIFEQNKIGVIVNENDENSIITGILEISNQIESYRAYARKFYDTVDNTKTIRNVISGLNNESQ